MLDEKYENDHDAPFDEYGNRPLVPHISKIIMLKQKYESILPEGVTATPYNAIKSQNGLKELSSKVSRISNKSYAH